MTEASPILRIERLGRQVGDKRIVHDVSLEVARGDVLAVAGPSGAGKSSLLRMLNRLDEPTSGTVYLADNDGKLVDYRSLPPAELRRRVVMVMQTAFLFPGTVADNIRFGPAQRGELLSDDAMQRLLARVGLEGFAGREVHNLSGGEAQRIAVARALAVSPAVLLLDEPTSALDEASKLGVESLIRDIVERDHLTCVMVTHDLRQAARLANRVAILESGALVRLGTSTEVLGAEGQL